MLPLKCTICSLFLLTNVWGQQVKKVFLDPSDSTKNCYTILYPDQRPWKGCMFLLPGFGESAEKVLQQTDLPVLAAQSGILTVIPTLQEGVLSFIIDRISQESLHKMIADVVGQHPLTNAPFFIGGFSIGGSGAVKYAEHAISENAAIKPTAVFAIDPPLDFERFYNACTRNVRLSVKTKPSEENVYMINRLEQVTGGPPQTAIHEYYALSPYSFSDTTQKAIKPLIHLPIRLYTEPDVNWWIQQRGSDLSAMNALDCSAMINEMNRLGNNKAVLVTTQDKGYRKPDNRRHPHSWSIAESHDLIQWLLGQR